MSSRELPKFACYEWIEERGMDLVRTERQRRVPLIRTANETIVTGYQHSSFPWRQTRVLEGRENTDLSEGVWTTNHYRVERRIGDPGVKFAPREADPGMWATGINEIARKMRLHHYVRLKSHFEVRQALQERHVEVRFGLELTSDWYNPLSGLLPDVPQSDVIRGSHAIPVVAYQPELKGYVFRNSWGEEWGDEGLGLLPASYWPAPQFLLHVL